MKLSFLILSITCASLIGGLHPANGADYPWKAGLATADITPTEPVMLAGYASRNQPADGKLDDLHAKALALEDETGQRSLIITADIVGFTADIENPIRERIAEKTGIARERILLNASHTHTGPALLLRRNEETTSSGEQTKKSVAYTHRLQDICVKLAPEAISHLQPARLSMGSGVVNFPMNRREFTEKGVILGVNPRGPVDRGVSVLRVDHPDGRMACVLFRASCHNTTFGSKDNQVSGDYAGFAQSFVERELPGTQAMFMQGLAGDTNPYPNSNNDPAKRPAEQIAQAHGAELGSEVVRVLNGKLRTINGPLTIAYGIAELPLAKRPSNSELEKLTSGTGSWRKWASERMLADAAANKPAMTVYPAPVAVWQFGTDLTMVGLSGEVVVDYVQFIEQAIGPLNLWLASYCHDTFGYVPSARVLKEGGYETRGLYSGGVGFFAPEAQNVLIEKVRELAKRAGRIP